MDWEAFATPPAPVSAVYGGYAKALYHMNKPYHEFVIAHALAAADATYFGTCNWTVRGDVE